MPDKATKGCFMTMTRFLTMLALLASSSITLAQVIPGRYIAVFKDEVRDHPAAAKAMAAQHGLSIGHVYEHALKGFVFNGSTQAVMAVSQRANIAYVEPDQICQAWEQKIPTGINRADVEKAVTITGSSGLVDVDIAIIDTGLDSNHPDLNVITGGVRFYMSRNRILSDTRWEDDNGHGTHVGGTAAAKDNDLGVVGVAPGARLTAVKVLDAKGEGTVSGIIAGVDWVAARASTFEVANMSLGGGYSQAQNDAVRKAVEKGVVFVVAAGNDGMDAALYSPASEPTAITVSALADSDGLPGGKGPATFLYGADDSFATFSNFGSVVDLCAPGVDILSTLMGGGYGTGSGTSMASPHVAGAAALYIARNGLTKSAAGVAAVADALKNKGWTLGDPEYLLSGDKDNYQEPLLNVGGLFNSAPTVKITSPADDAVFPDGQLISFSASASDAEDGGVTSPLVWTSSIDGRIWTGDSFSKVLSENVHTITATATDSKGAEGSASITVTVGTPNMPPTVTINSPANDAKFASGDTISFSAVAYDDRDGQITTPLVWTSSINGQIGSTLSGEFLFSKALSDGTHTITATATDSEGLTGIASITLTVGSSIVVPSGFENLDDDGWSGTISSAVRLQEVYSAANFSGPVTITGMAFRLDNSSTATAGKITIRVRLSTTTAQPDNLSSTFGANIGSNVKEVFPVGEVQINSKTGSWPNAFDLNIPFATSFTYDPGKGNLLVDITTSAGAPGVFVDASNEKTDGASRAFSSNITATKAAARDSGADVIRFKVAP